MSGRVTVLLFAGARTAVGRARLEWPVGPEGVTARSLVRSLGEKYPALVPVLRMSRFFRNRRSVASTTTRVHAGDEFAVHPPYGGG